MSIKWSDRTNEEKNLLNPAFCSSIVWCASISYFNQNKTYLSYEESFLILPFVLHRKTREKMPTTIRTSMAVWLSDNPLFVTGLANRSRLLVPFTKESLLFGGMRGLFDIKQSKIIPQKKWRPIMQIHAQGTSDEVQSCFKKAEFLGRWFSQTGDAITVFSLLGLKP